MKSKNILYPLLGTMAILSIPFVAKVSWDMSDYVTASILLFATGLLLVVVINNIRNQKKKIIVSGIIIALTVYVWAELAVGIFTSLGS
jgi:hypothetical protein